MEWDERKALLTQNQNLTSVLRDLVNIVFESGIGNPSLSFWPTMKE
jgi:hypothetical protein